MACALPIAARQCLLDDPRIARKQRQKNACRAIRHTSALFPIAQRPCRYAVRERATLEVRPSFACYYPGEMPVVTVNAKAGKPSDLRISLRVYSRDTQKEVYAHVFQAKSDKAPRSPSQFRCTSLPQQVSAFKRRKANVWCAL